MSLMFEDVEVIKALPVELTKAEIDERFRRGVELHRQVSHFKNEAKSAAKDWKAKIERTEDEYWTLVDAATTGRELREVKCIERRDHSRGIIEVLRVDTGERIIARPMKDSDKQAELPIEDTDSDKGKGKGKKKGKEAPAAAPAADAAPGTSPTAPVSEIAAAQATRDSAPADPPRSVAAKWFSVGIAAWDSLSSTTHDRLGAELAHASIEAGGHALEWERQGDYMQAGPLPEHAIPESLLELAIEVGLGLQIENAPRGAKPAAATPPAVDASAGAGDDDWPEAETPGNPPAAGIAPPEPAGSAPPVPPVGEKNLARLSVAQTVWARTKVNDQEEFLAAAARLELKPRVENGRVECYPVDRKSLRVAGLMQLARSLGITVECEYIEGLSEQLPVSSNRKKKPKSPSGKGEVRT